MSDIGPGSEENRTSEQASEAIESVQSAVPERDRETNQWAMFIRFFILAGWIVP